MIALAAAVTAAAGTALILSAGTRRPGVHDRRGGAAPAGTTPGRRTVAPAGRPAQWLAQAGLAEVAAFEFAAVMAALALGGALAGYALFGSASAAAVGAAAAGCTPIGLYRNRRLARRELSQDEWPRLIEELRMRATTLGRSIPQALFETGAGAPVEMRSAFDAAQRQWLISTDFASTLEVLKAHLADSTADLVCETVLIAYELGGSDLGPRLAALADDRRTDVAARRDARAKQAGVRFARRFVLAVPLGMALAGSLIGSGRQAYRTPSGQLLVVVALALTGGCWAWAGRYLRLPEPRRPFATGHRAGDTAAGRTT